MQIKLHPRAHGEAARAVITEYSIPIADPDQNPSDDGFPTNDGTFWSQGTPSAHSLIAAFIFPVRNTKEETAKLAWNRTLDFLRK
jgi:hypothetical protein